MMNKAICPSTYLSTYFKSRKNKELLFHPAVNVDRHIVARSEFLLILLLCNVHSVQKQCHITRRILTECSLFPRERGSDSGKIRRGEKSVADTTREESKEYVVVRVHAYSRERTRRQGQAGCRQEFDFGCRPP